MVRDAQIKIVEDVRQSLEYGRYLESLGWKVSVVGDSKANIFVRKLGPISLCKLQRTGVAPSAVELDVVFRKNNIFMCKIEPNEMFTHNDLDKLKKNGFRQSKWPLLGTKTSRVNLNPETGVIFDGFKKDCRYCIRKAQEAGGQKIQLGDTDRFYSIWKQSAKRKSLWIPKEKEFQDLIQAFKNKVLTVTVADSAGAIVLMHKKTAFYYYAGATREGVKKEFPYLVVWTAMTEAKNKGCVVWDFEGIYDSRWPNSGWIGFSHFKNSFGGKAVEFPGSFEKWRWPLNH